MDAKKKKWLIGGGVAAAVVAAVASFFIFKSKTDDYCSAIPQNTVALVKVDANKFLESNGAKMDELVSKGISQLSKMGGKEEAVMAEDFYKNSGIDFTRPFYGFVTEEASAGVVFALTDGSKLAEYLKKLGAPVSERDGFKVIAEHSASLIIDNNRALLAGNIDTKKAIEWMKQDKDKSVMSTSLFENLNKSEEPAAMIISSKQLWKVCERFMSGREFKQMKQMVAMQGMSLDDLDMDLILGANMKSDKAYISLECIPNSQAMKDYVNEAEKFCGKIDPSFATNCVDDPALWAGFAINSSKLLEIVDALPLDALMEQMNLSIDVKSLVQSVGGQISFMIPTVIGNKVIAQASVKNNSILNTLISILPANEASCISNMGGDQYVYDESNKYRRNSYIDVDSIASEDEFDSYYDSYSSYADSYHNNEKAYFGIRNGVMYFSNDMDLASKAGSSVNSKLSALSSDMSDCTGYATLNISKFVDYYIGMGYLEKGNVPASIVKRLKMLDRLTLKMGVTKAELSVSVKDGKNIFDVMFK